MDNLLVRVEDMAFRLQPTFVTLTWRSAFKDEELWLRIGAKIQKKFGVDVLLHLTCHLPVEDLRRVLRRAREAGIQNILALRGDPPIGEASWRPVAGGLANAVELVRLIREEHGDYFCVAVAAYPETHIECWNHEDLPPSEQSRLLDLERLKAKVDAGADFIITQFFYDVDMYLEFVERCRALGIACPILPGYMPIQTYKGFCKFTKWCRTRVPEFVLRDLEDIAENDEAVKAYGIDLGIRTCRALLQAGTRALHFYTMNLALSVSKILEALDLVPKTADRTTPWAGTAGTLSRPREEVRPIFWANRAASYLSRTAEWDEYPNGRWGDSRSPAYGELTDYYLAFKRPLGERRALWGTPASEADIVAVFVRYLEGAVPQLPWCESNLAAESGAIFDNLHWLNRHGFLTINSQPKVNGLPSSDDKHGWGGSDGFVFQKAYLEFFVKPDLFERFVAAIPRYPSLTFHAINRRGDEVTNLGRDHDGAETVNAVTWGVFPGREIIQPTVVDPVSFRAWKDEAFGLWVSQWAATYDKDTVRRPLPRTTSIASSAFVAFSSLHFSLLLFLALLSSSVVSFRLASLAAGGRARARGDRRGGGQLLARERRGQRVRGGRQRHFRHLQGGRGRRDEQGGTPRYGSGHGGRDGSLPGATAADARPRGTATWRIRTAVPPHLLLRSTSLLPAPFRTRPHRDWPRTS